MRRGGAGQVSVNGGRGYCACPLVADARSESGASTSKRLACTTRLPSMFAIDMRNGASSRVPAIGANAISMSRPSDEIFDHGARAAMARDRLEGHRAYHDRPGIALLGLDLVHALERELEVEAAAPVEYRQRPLAGRLGQAVVAARGRNEQRGERIDDRRGDAARSAPRGRDRAVGAEAESSVTLPLSMTSFTSSVSSSVVVRAMNSVGCGRPSVMAPLVASEPSPLASTRSTPLARPLMDMVYLASPNSAVAAARPDRDARERNRVACLKLDLAAVRSLGSGGVQKREHRAGECQAQEWSEKTHGSTSSGANSRWIGLPAARVPIRCRSCSSQGVARECSALSLMAPSLKPAVISVNWRWANLGFLE